MTHKQQPESSCCAHHAEPQAGQTAQKHRDPVCGMEVDADPEKSAEYSGQTYYFCCNGCKTKFSADPAAWLSGKKPASTPARTDIEYTCPMHPEVVQIGPGTCPKCGMALEASDASAASDDGELRDMESRLRWSLACTVPLVVLAMSDTWPALQAVLATPVLFWNGWPFLQRGYASFKARHLNMFSLIAVGTLAAYLFSLTGLLAPQLLPAQFKQDGMAPLYFEAAGVIVSLVLLGQVLELRARERSRSAIGALLRLAPETAWAVDPFGREREIALDQVRPGMRLMVKPGARIPVDGTVVKGSSHVDEAMLTGESLPVTKEAGMKVAAGTLNTDGSLLLRADKVGQDTALANIVRLVNEASRSRAPIQSLADGVSAWFVPAVIACAALAFIAWSLFGPAPAMANGLLAAVSVLIVACPCALGLATPVAVTLGIGRGAQEGVLIKNAAALQALERIDLLALDKTGTLTTGELVVRAEEWIEGAKRASVTAGIAALESHSEHPLARALRQWAGKDHGRPEVEQFSATRGRGVSGVVDGKVCLLGNRAWMEQHGIGLQAFEAFSRRADLGDCSEVWFASDGEALCALALGDVLKPGAADAIRALQARKIRVVLLSGDREGAVAAMAGAAGITEYHAALLPEDKRTLVARWKAAGRHVAMAGDGINDAPALAEAEVGIAMGTGTDIAIDSADVVLPKGDLQALVRALQLGRASMRNIRQNLFFAFVYNFLGVPLAAGVLFPWLGWLLNPMAASAAMSLSSVSVIANALRLRKTRLED